jgi:hypothetical protein
MLPYLFKFESTNEPQANELTDISEEYAASILWVED